MKRISKIFGIVGLVVLVLVLALGISLVLSNLNDEPLSPEVKQIFAQSHPEIATDENGYFSLIGVHGPEHMTPHEWGLRWHEAASRMDGEGGRTSDLQPEQEQQLFSLPQDAPCQDIENCLEEVLARPEETRRVLEQAQSFLDRCNLTLNYERYQEPWRPQMGLAAALPLYSSTCRDLQSLHFALKVAEHQDEVAIAYLGRVMKFHTLHLQGSVTLLSKVVAISYLFRDYRLLNQYLLLRPTESLRQILAMRKLLKPLSDKGRSMEVVLKSEITFAARGFLDLQGVVATEADGPDGEGASQGLFEKISTELLYLSNATVNEYYREIRPVLILERSSGRTYRELAMAMENEQECEKDRQRSLYTLRNPVGHILIQIGLPSFLPYLEARDNLLALRALVAFQCDLLARGITDSAAIEQAVTQARLVHRYTGEASIWNKDDRTLFFPATAGSGRDPIVIRL
ncbi:MAG: hypothetical protein P8103_07310 [Candidatus Thiodiazotropha sp.]